MASAKNRKRYDAVQETRAVLAETFPNCFSPKGASKPPIAIGLHRDIAQRCPELKGVRNALRDYTRSPTYLRNMIAGAARIDLDGLPFGSVTAEEADVAARLLATIERNAALRIERQSAAAQSDIAV